MTVLVSDVIDDSQTKYPDLGDTLGLELAQKADDWINRAIRLRSESTEDISLTSGTAAYSLSDDVLKVWAAYYLTSATSGYRLDETSVDEMDVRNPEWRIESAGQPNKWMDSGQQIRFHPAPNDSTSGSYPIVRLFTTERVTLTANTALPTNVPSHEAWSAYINYLWAKRTRGDAEAATNLRVALFHLEEIKKHIYGRAARQKPSAEMDVPQIDYC